MNHSSIMNQSSKKNIFSLKIFIRWFVFVEKKILISLNSLIWKTKSTKKYWFEKSSTNSTNQRIKFSLICKNVDELSMKIPMNWPNFQRINSNFQSIDWFRKTFQRINDFRRFFSEFSLIFWNFRWFVEFFVENSLKFGQINENLIRWFVEFVSLISLIRWIRWKNQRK